MFKSSLILGRTEGVLFHFLYLQDDANEYSDNNVQLGAKDHLPPMCGSSSSSSAQSSPPHASSPNQSNLIPAIHFTNLKLDNSSPHPLPTCSKLNNSPRSKSHTLSPLPPIHMGNCINVNDSHLSKSITNSTTSDEGNECRQDSVEKIIHIATSDSSSTRVPFDICLDKTGTPFKLKSSLLVQNRQKRNEVKRAIQGQSIIELRPGMVLLKHYISCRDQVFLQLLILMP